MNDVEILRYRGNDSILKRLKSIRRLQIKAEFIIGGLAANSNANATNKGGMVAMGGSRNNQSQGPNNTNVNVYETKSIHRPFTIALSQSL